jgi:hypothetical protein
MQTFKYYFELNAQKVNKISFVVFPVNKQLVPWKIILAQKSLFAWLTGKYSSFVESGISLLSSC